MSGIVVPCCSARARNCTASSRIASPLNAQSLRPRSRRELRTVAAGLRELAERLSLFDQETCLARQRLWFQVRHTFDMDKRRYDCDLELYLLASKRAGVAGKDEIWLSARVNCATASTNAERASDRCPALPHRPAPFSISPASVQ